MSVDKRYYGFMYYILNSAAAFECCFYHCCIRIPGHMAIPYVEGIYQTDLFCQLQFVFVFNIIHST